MVIGPQPGLIFEEDAGTLLRGERADLRVNDFLPLVHAFRVPLVRPVKRALRRKPHLLQQAANLNLGELDAELPPDQITDNLARPQAEVKLKLPRITSGDDCVKLRHLRRTEPGGGSRSLFRLQRQGAARVIFLLPPEDYCPGNTKHSRDQFRLVSLFEKLYSAQSLFRCRPSALDRHKLSLPERRSPVYKSMNYLVRRWDPRSPWVASARACAEGARARARRLRSSLAVGGERQRLDRGVGDDSGVVAILARRGWRAPASGSRRWRRQRSSCDPRSPWVASARPPV